MERPLLVALLCVALAFLVYAPSLGNGFYNDDALFLNHAERVLAEPLAAFTDRPLNYFRPTWSVYVTAQRALFGLQAAGYHAVGIALHGLTGFLVWLLARRLLGSRWPPLAAAAAFVCFFAHSEAPLWIAAHNSTLAAALCTLAVLLHLRAAEPGPFRTGRALLTALVVLLALWAKEPSAVVLAWLPLAEAAVFGLASVFRRAALLRFAFVALAAAVFVASNARLGEAFADPAAAGAGAPVELRATFSFLSVEGVFGATAWLFSPLRHVHDEARWWHGALLLAAVLSLVAWRRRALLPAALCAAALLLTAMLPATMTRQLQPNSSRLYYFPTVGAALLVGVAASCAERRATRGLAAAALVAGCVWHGSAIRALNAADYRPIGRLQTQLAEELGPVLASAGPHPVVLAEPWIGNVLHLQEFLLLYWDVAPARVRRTLLDSKLFAEWVARQRQLDPSVQILDWDDAHWEGSRGLIPAEGAPPRRNDAPFAPRRAEDLRHEPRVTLLSIAPK
ncbi:MAG: hypothetical protein ACT4PU_12370 [Planctomycetota bacterium]